GKPGDHEGVHRLHGERALGSTHDQSFAGDQVDDLVRKVLSTSVSGPLFPPGGAASGAAPACAPAGAWLALSAPLFAIATDPTPSAVAASTPAMIARAFV